MVTLDDRLSDPSAGTDGGWGHPFVTGWTPVLPVALAGGLAVAALAAWLMVGWGAGEDGSAQAAVSSSEVSLASGPEAAAPPQACARIQSIVETACGYRQHDHDSDGIRQCVSYELKYTMWSAYGCQ